MNMKKFLMLTLSLLLLFSVFIGLGLNAYVSAETEDDVICAGVYIDTVDVSNMTATQAKEAVDQYLSELTKTEITIKIDDAQVKTSIGDLGFECAENEYIENALKVGKSGNLIKRYKELKDIEKDQLVFQLEFTFDDEKVKTLVEKECSAFDVKPVNATLTRSGGDFVITNETVGRKVVKEETIEKIKNSITVDWDHNNIVVEASVVEDAPEFTSELLKRCNTRLGTYSTTYGDSSASRAKNLSTGSKFINGTVLYPGEVFSAYEHMNPFTTENGYSVAGAYLNGEVVDSIGGGACQVTTTLYNAVLLSELEIVQRMAHSMTVSYVKPAMDAAISGTYKDLKFKNNTEVPIYIEGYTRGRTITFSVYGEENRPDNRTIKYVSEVTKTIQPGKEKVTKDPKKPTTFREVTQKAHIGRKANLYKIVYVDGKQVSKDLINSSSYAAEPQYVTIGTKEVEPEETKEPKPTKDPEATQAPVQETIPPVEVTPVPVVTPDPNVVVPAV